ncbi:MAG: tRNA (guanosine(46)-N7)-methyltransferase TrmB [Gammaproteobacteria bacterium]|nr:tRNA (guanosine(46)-N7)-methyltransferase TrmB [Gammaproteobacteria bacterium]
MDCSSKVSAPSRTHGLIQPIEESRLERIRSYVRREGRMTDAQRSALAELWPHYGLDVDLTGEPAPLDLDAVFSRRAVRHFEIGIGMGDVLVDLATKNPDQDFIGIDVYRPGIGRVLGRLAENGIENVRVFCGDAVTVLERVIPAESLDHVYLLYPDPWPKKRHHKRRLLQTGFARLIASRLRPEGLFHLATDWEHYALHMRTVLDAMPEFTNASGRGNFAPRPDYRTISRFERRGDRLGHAHWDLTYRKNPKVQK